ncbi:MAG: class I SAM-dependent methyltransferase, partial [Proteobacteria bacterium]|nr:class I SAM-dependent methyltransferase [Pseudomonadota bacterium]
DRFSQYSLYGDLYKCKSCGLITQKLEHTVDEILTLLKDEKYLDEAIGGLNIEEKGAQFRKLITLMKRTRVLEGARLLDVGTNTGVFLQEFKSYSENVQGIEPSEEAATTARELFGHKIENTVIAEANLDDGKFDIITMWDVIEHLYDPRNDLETLYRKLKQGGVIFITTHDVSDWFAKIMGSHYPNYMYQHFFHFSHKTLTMILEMAGFHVVNLIRFGKSWSLGYFHEMLFKIWPEGKLILVVRMLIKPLLRIPGVPQLQITIPIRNFFIIAAERPTE